VFSSVWELGLGLAEQPLIAPARDATTANAPRPALIVADREAKSVLFIRHEGGRRKAETQGAPRYKNRADRTVGAIRTEIPPTIEPNRELTARMATQPAQRGLRDFGSRLPISGRARCAFSFFAPP